MRVFHFLWFATTTTALQTLPPVTWTKLNETVSGFEWQKLVDKQILILNGFSNVTDTEGLTIDPPSAFSFAETFRDDVSALTGIKWSLSVVDSFDSNDGIRLGPFRPENVTLEYENGVRTEEGYEIEIGENDVYIGGTGARGMWWGTRTLLQELLIANASALPAGRTVDAPAYATRGFMLDAGRKWYDANFLKELCTYASFFKMSEFHYHSSDNYPLNRGHNETWNEVYSQFSLRPEDLELQGIVQRRNETLSRLEFEDFQDHCARRGVTVIPEIEAPGHCLSITKWKPHLALPKKDLLNLTHPDAIPTVKALWKEFLPWFRTKEVHIGADEYNATLADDYINFVNEMASFINETSGKRVRIWGTNEPSKTLEVSKNIIIQHWQYGESNPVKLYEDGYDLINSEDWWGYMSLKNDHTPIFPATYPQFFNVTRTLNFANVNGWQWDPSLFNPVNITKQLPSNAKGNRGAIIAAWNDNGPDATTQLEAYYAMREGIPVAAARSWNGSRGPNLTLSSLNTSLSLLMSFAPGQNLDRRLPSAPLSNSTTSSSSLPACSWYSSTRKSMIILDKCSYGPPYTLLLNASTPFTLSGSDTTLTLQNPRSNTSLNSSAYSLTFTTSDGWFYPLRHISPFDLITPSYSSHPGRIWSNSSLSTHEEVYISLPVQIRIETDYENGSLVWVDGKLVGRFEVFVFGGRNTLFSWSQMAFVAPLGSVSGGVEGRVFGGVGGDLGMEGN